jgi:hypothetical protein
MLVPRPKRRERDTPSVDFMISGISIPKNRTPLYGQNARAKSIPSKNVPMYHFDPSQFLKDSNLDPPDEKDGNFMISNITSPIIINIGQRILSHHPWNILAI